MTVSKTSASRLRKDARPYTTLPNKTVDAIKDTDALAIWVYLQSKPEGWIVRSTDIQRHFGIGRDRYRKSMRYLSCMGIVSYVKARDEGGHLSGTDIHVHYDPTEGLKTRRSVNPTVGESTPLVIEGESSNGSKTINCEQRDALNHGKDKRKQKTALPESFEPNETCRKKAASLDVPLEHELEKFKDFHDSKGNKYVDWQAAFRTWLAKAAEFRASRANVKQFPQNYDGSDCGGKAYIPSPAGGGS
jgi:hypothetical protein